MGASQGFIVWQAAQLGVQYPKIFRGPFAFCLVYIDLKGQRLPEGQLSILSQPSFDSMQPHLPLLESVAAGRAGSSGGHTEMGVT